MLVGELVGELVDELAGALGGELAEPLKSTNILLHRIYSPNLGD